jgi:alpha-L-fucosidase
MERWGDFTWVARIRIRGAAESTMQVRFRSADGNNGYYFLVHGAQQQVSLYKVIQGEEVLLSKSNVRLIAGDMYTLRIETKHQDIRCFVEQFLAIRVEDTTFQEGAIVVDHNDASVEVEILHLDSTVRSFPLSREERVASWYQSAKLGLFIHWGTNIGNFDWKLANVPPTYKNTEAFENAAWEQGWSADKWVKKARDIGAQYIILATFHSTCGYLRIWPSGMPGTPSTKRDFLQEILHAAEQEGIRVLVYMTNQAIWAINKYNKFEGVNWVDPEAYRQYKQSPAIDIAKRDHFINYFVRDVFDELIPNYPKLAGFWYDGWDTKDVNHRIEEATFAYVHQRMPDALNIKNNYTSTYAEDEDVMSLEDWKGADQYAKAPGSHYGVAYHYNLPNSTKLPPTIRESSFKTIGGWKYGDYRPELSDHPDDIKRIVTIVANNWVAVPGYGPLVSGDFPEALQAFHEGLVDFMSWAKPSLHQTVGGGFGQGGFAPGYWNDGFAGVTTLEPGGNTHYIHVLETSSHADQLILSDCGYNVRSVTDLRTGRKLQWNQTNGFLAIEFHATHESDTIIMVITEGLERVISGHELPGSHVATPQALPCEVKLTWSGKKRVYGLKITQAETSAIPDSTRVKDVEVYTLDTNNSLRSVTNVPLHNQRGMQVIHWEPFVTEQLMLRAMNNYNNTEQCQILNLEILYLDDESTAN